MAVSDLAYIDSAGYHYADFPTYLAYVQGVFQGIYGQDIYLGADSQDGQFAAAFAQALFDTASLGASDYNSFAPVTAQGTGLSRVVKINGLSRVVANYSTVNLDIGGTEGTTLTNCIAVDSFQQQWSIPTVTIPNTGTITVTATALTIGAIQADANTITGLFTPTQGWQTVNNPAAATPGTGVESDAALRARQAVSTSNPSLTVFQGTLGAVANVPDVTKVKGYENPTNSTDANGLPPHSFAVVIVGGDAMAIAQAIQIHKTPGTQTVGTTSEVVYDSNGMPITIHFYVATQATINCTVTINTLVGYTSAYAALIQEAISAAIAAYPIGADIVLTQLYVAAYLIGTPAGATFQIVSIQISKNSDPLGNSNVQLLFNEVGVCDASSVVVIT